MSTTTISTKRLLDLQDLATSILSDPIKRRRLQAITELSNSNKRSEPLSNTQGFSEISTHNPFVPSSGIDSDSSQLHNLPRDSIPVIESPYEIRQFFTDYDYSQYNTYHKTVQRMHQLFPPPMPPPMPTVSGTNGSPQDANGIMIPFVYPPPPIIKPSPYIDDNDFFLNKRDGGRSSSSGKTRWHHRNKENNKQPEGKPVALAPLLFPPPNFMPYPLNANKSTITPHDLFTDFLDASLLLPRIDMVVASAAGSLADLKSQALQEGFDITEYENDCELRRLEEEERDLEASDSNDGDYGQVREDSRSYYDNIDISNQFDDQPNVIYTPFDGYMEPYVQVHSNLSDVKHKVSKDVLKEVSNPNVRHNIPSQRDLLGSMQPFNYRDSLEKRRQIVHNALNNIERTSDEYKLELIEERKKELLSRIESLRSSKILMSDVNNTYIESEELADIKSKLDTKRDLELLKLKFETDYEKLRQSANYYNDTNKAYKKYNSTVSNKLLKLKNFFEYQRGVMNDILSDGRLFNELVDLNSKDSSKIYADIVDRDYKKDMRKLIKMKMNGFPNDGDDGQDEEEGEDATKKGKETKKETIGSLVNKIKHTKFSENLREFNEVSDFMPLISSKEFNLITTNIKGNNDVKMNLNHHIFRTPVYESGSDSNYTSQGSEAPKRRGRRANVGLEVEEGNVNSEAYLLAKITKHFVGPQSVTTEEMDDDIKRMGVSSKWN